MHAFLSDSIKPHHDISSPTPWRVLMVGLPDSLHQHISELTRPFTWMDRPFEIHQASSIESGVRLSFDHAYSTILINQALIKMGDDDHAIRALREDASRYQSRFILLSETPSNTPMAEWLLENAIDDHHCYPNVSDNQWLLILGRGCHFFHTKRTRRLLSQGMEQTLAVFDTFLESESVDHFREAILKQVSAGLGLDTPEMMLFERHSVNEQLMCTFATQHYHPNQKRRLSSLTDEEVKALCLRAISNKETSIHNNLTAFYQALGSSECLWVIKDVGCPKDRHQQLIEHVLSAILKLEKDIKANAFITQQLEVDALTGLASETSLINQLQQSPYSRQNIAIINIAQFRSINEAFGVKNADQVLIAVADRFRNYFDGQCFIARLYADTFVLVGPEEALVKRRLESVLNIPLLVGETELTLHFYLSVNPVNLPISNPKHWIIEHEPFKVLLNAQACEKTACLRHGKSNDLADLQALTKAFYEGELQLIYQPIINLQTRSIFAFDCRILWDRSPLLTNNDLLRLLSLGANERLISDLSDWVLRVGIQTFRELKPINPDLRAVFVPVSLTQLYSNDFVKQLSHLIQEYLMVPSELILHLPIEATLDTSTELMDTTQQLISAGADLAIGPLGASAHLNQLSKLPISLISFDLQHFTDEQAEANLIDAYLTLSNALCTTDIARNITSLNQAHDLAIKGCGLGQGEALAPLMRYGEFQKWLERNRSLPF
jgi:EAL domain-containing protein (putative c-di-GMP-specific phosphodiesterase class I)